MEDVKKVQKAVPDFCIKSQCQRYEGEEHRSWKKRKKMRGHWTVTRHKEWSTHWRCDEEAQKAQDNPWKNEELRRYEEALPRLKEGDLEKASRMYKAKTGVGCDGFHPKIPLDLTKETRGEIVEHSGKWPQQESKDEKEKWRR